MVQNFALAAIVALFATATFASSDVKKEESTVEAGKEPEKKTEEDKEAKK